MSNPAREEEKMVPYMGNLHPIQQAMMQDHWLEQQAAYAMIEQKSRQKIMDQESLIADLVAALEAALSHHMAEQGLVGADLKDVKPDPESSWGVAAMARAALASAKR